MNKVITVNREFSSGGREVAKRTADILGIGYYDEEIVDKTASETKLHPEYIKKFSETAVSRSFPIVFGHTLVAPQTSPLDELQVTQQEVIREFAKLSSCIIVGRCASHIVSDVNLLKIFVYSSDMEERINRCFAKVPSDKGKIRGEMEKLILSTDKNRAKYFKEYTSKTWRDMSAYNLCIDTAKIPVKQAAELIADVYLRMK